MISEADHHDLLLPASLSRRLARLGHFGRVAEAGAITQPALSIQIRELETYLGGGFVRAAAGHHSLDRPFQLPAVRASFPLPELALRETQADMLITELLSGDLDAVMISLLVDHPDCASLSLFEDAFLLVVPAEGPLAQDGHAARPELLEREDLLLLEDGHCLRGQALKMCANADRAGSVPMAPPASPPSCNRWRTGRGVTLLPELFIDAEGGDGPAGAAAALHRSQAQGRPGLAALFPAPGGYRGAGHGGTSLSGGRPVNGTC